MIVVAHWLSSDREIVDLNWPFYVKLCQKHSSLCKGDMNH